MLCFPRLIIREISQIYARSVIAVNFRGCHRPSAAWQMMKPVQESDIDPNDCLPSSYPESLREPGFLLTQIARIRVAWNLNVNLVSSFLVPRSTANTTRFNE